MIPAPDNFSWNPTPHAPHKRIPNEYIQLLQLSNATTAYLVRKLRHFLRFPRVLTGPLDTFE